MPTSTFFRLPEEKRRRLMDAAWGEFTAVPFVSASINRIVGRAQIPRGSFYQYFEDKEDLFFYLLGTVREESLGMLRRSLDEAGGDPFSAALSVFDYVFEGRGTVRASMAPVIAVIRINGNMDVSRMLEERIRSDPEVWALNEHVDWSLFRRGDEAFKCEVAMFLVFCFACSMRGVLEGTVEYTTEKERMRSRLDILRRGSMKAEANERKMVS